MSFSEFLRHYSRVEVCTLTPDTILDDSVKHWSVGTFDGTWRRGSTAGGCRNNPCKTNAILLQHYSSQYYNTTSTLVLLLSTTPVRLLQYYHSTN